MPFTAVLNKFRAYLTDYAASDSVDLDRLETILFSEDEKKRMTVETEPDDNKDEDDDEDQEEEEEEEEEEDESELLEDALTRSVRPITPEMLALILCCRPQTVKDIQRGDAEHPIRTLLGNYVLRKDPSLCLNAYTEDELVALLATLVEDPTVQKWRYHDMEVLDLVREDLESWEEDEAGVTDRILHKLKEYPAPNKDVPLPTPTTPEVAEIWLASLLRNKFIVEPNISVVNDAVDALSDEALARVLTVENSKRLLLEWGSHDVGNDVGPMILRKLSCLPTEVVCAYSTAILCRVDHDILDDGEHYNWHESYQYLWQAVCKGLARKDPGALTSYVKTRLLPRLQEADDDDEDKLLAVAMLEDISAENAACLRSCSSEIIKAMEGLTEDGDLGVSGTKVSKLRDSCKAQQAILCATESKDEPPAKRVRTD